LLIFWNIFVRLKQTQKFLIVPTVVPRKTLLKVTLSLLMVEKFDFFITSFRRNYFDIQFSLKAFDIKNQTYQACLALKRVAFNPSEVIWYKTGTTLEENEVPKPLNQLVFEKKNS